LLWTATPIGRVSVEISDFKNDRGQHLTSGIASAHFVRYVMTDEFAGGCGHCKPEDFASSLSADMLDNLTHYDLEAKKVRPVWLTVRIPEDAQPGIYTAKVRVRGEGEKDQELDLSLEVIDRSEEHTSELQSRENLVCRLLLEKEN